MMESSPLLVAATLERRHRARASPALGLLINERAGIVNLGAEGMMLVAAIAGFATAVHTGSDWLGVRAPARCAGALLAAAFGVLVIWLNTNQYATGLALSLFGAGFSAFVGIRYTQEKLGERPQLRDPGPGRHAVHRPGAVPPAPDGLRRDRARRSRIAWFLYRSRAGLVLRAVGESPESAHALGYPVRRIRLAAVIVGGALCGVAGAYISVVYTPLWVEGMIAGKGWIALALTTFATWRPARVLLGAYLFGGVTMLQFHLQGEGVQVAEPVPDDAAVPRDHRRAGADLAQRRRGSASTCRRRSASRSSPAHDVARIDRCAVSRPSSSPLERPMTRPAKRSLLQLAGCGAVAALAALVGCSKKEETPRRHAPRRRRRRRRPPRRAEAASR